MQDAALHWNSCVVDLRVSTLEVTTTVYQQNFICMSFFSKTISDNATVHTNDLKQTDLYLKIRDITSWFSEVI